MKLYDFAPSGNCYKARMMLARLDIPYERIPTDPTKGETKKLEFLALSAKGRTPLLVMDDGTALPESNAILAWLAQDTPWWCEERLERARMLEWMFWEQNNHETTIATRRHWLHEDERPA
ncbi:MAG TPA: glutathione S-transferase N-terminal domain-containing protein, partial [Planctomycetota bacterium]